jgi:Spy/CpxP family protein refolding chaperone
VKRSAIKAALYLALTFSAGAAVGVFGNRLYSGHSVSADVRPTRSEEYRRVYLQEMETRLKLDADQKHRLVGILDQTESQFRQLNEKHRPEYRAIHAAQSEQISSLLNPAQLEEFAKLRAEREARRKKRDGPGQY